MQATVGKLMLNPCSESNPKSYSCLGHYSPVNISQRRIYPLCSKQVWSGLSSASGRKANHNQKTEIDLPVFRHLPQKPLLTVYHCGQSLCWQQSHHSSSGQVPSWELHAQHALLQSPVAWKNMNTFYENKNLFWNSFTTAAVPESLNPRDRKSAGICLFCTQFISCHS